MARVMTLWTRDRLAVLVDLEQRRLERAQEEHAREVLYPPPKNVVVLFPRDPEPPRAA